MGGLAVIQIVCEALSLVAGLVTLATAVISLRGQVRNAATAVDKDSGGRSSGARTRAARTLNPTGSVREAP